MNNQKIIIISLLLFILFSFSFLAISEKKQHTIENGWFLYFNNIEDQSLDFTIENYSKKNEFSWEISFENNNISEGSETVLKEAQKSVIINKPPQKGLFKITVYHDKEIKEIYKNFE